MAVPRKKCGNCKDERSPTCPDTDATACGQCHNPPAQDYSESCPPRYCPKEYPGMGAREIWAKYNSAVVEIHSEFNFTNATDPTLLPLAAEGLAFATTPASANALFSVYKHGAGAFIDQHIIVTAAQNVLAPPDHTLLYNRWPFTANQINPAALQSNIMTRAGRIFVDVYNVNGSGHSYTYQADIIGVYGLGDIALLYIDRQAAWNQFIPCIKKCHPHFRFGCSRRYRTGLPVFTMGSAFSRSMGGYSAVNSSSSYNNNQGHFLVEGVVADARHTDHLGYAQQELLVADFGVYAGAAGLPIINKFGHIIAIQTMNVAGAVTASNIGANAASNPTFFNQAVGDGLVAGPTQWFFMKPILRLICSLRSRNQDYIENITDPAGDYVRYIHAYLGLAWEVMDGQDYMAYRNSVNGRIQTRFDAANPGMYLATPLRKKEIIGITVAGLTVDSIAPSPFRGDIFLPGAGAAGSNVPTPWVTSPLSGSVRLNDIITHVERCPLGDIGKQIPLALITSRKRVGDNVELQIRSYASGYETQTRVVVAGALIPRFFDYPLYAYHNFPYGDAGIMLPFAGVLPQDPVAATTNPWDATLQVYTIPTC